MPTADPLLDVNDLDVGEPEQDLDVIFSWVFGFWNRLQRFEKNNR